MRTPYTALSFIRVIAYSLPLLVMRLVQMAQSGWGRMGEEKPTESEREKVCDQKTHLNIGMDGVMHVGAIGLVNGDCFFWATELNP